MKNNWWKILSILIILYTLVMGLAVPLKSGIYSAEPGVVKGNEKVRIKILGYNTHFSQVDPGSIRAWLRLEREYAISSDRIDVADDRKLTATFHIPPVVPADVDDTFLSIILDNEIDGAFVRPDEITIDPKSINKDELGEELWNAPLEGFSQKKGITFPFREILHETIRNTYYHIPLWFGMVILLFIAVVFSITYLRTNDPANDTVAMAFSTIAVLFGILGIVTGSLWAKFTWGAFWVWSDIKLIVTPIALLIYLAYFMLRFSFENEELKARISAVYSIFAFVSLVILIFVVPRVVGGSLHPGNSGNPGLGGEDLDNTMRMVFYPAIIGWTLFGTWLATLLIRIEKVRAVWQERMYTTNGVKR